MKMVVEYRHIGPDDYLTPGCYLPIQRTALEVAAPFGHEQVVDAIMAEFGDAWGWRRDDVRDVGFETIPEFLNPKQD